MKTLNRNKLLLRIITFPLWFATLLVFHIYCAIKGALNWLWFGGEMVNYREDEKGSIFLIYEELKNQKLENPDSPTSPKDTNQTS